MRTVFSRLLSLPISQSGKPQTLIGGEVMAEQTTVGSAADATDVDIESRIKSALRSRLSYFRQQADSLTFVGVRRLLEEDLGLEIYSLDPHKRFVKNYLEECLEAANNDQPKKEEIETNTAGGQTTEDSPVLGLMTQEKKAKGGTKETVETQSHVIPSETMIKEAISKRASHLRENAGSITGAGVRRILEEDLKLEKYSLDAFKKFISDQVTEVFSAPDVSKRATGDGKAKSRKSSHGKASKDSTKEELSRSSENESDEVEENNGKARKGTTPKGKVQRSAAVKKRKSADVEKNDSRRKSKVTKTKSEEDSEKESDAVSDDNSESSAERPVQKKEVAKPTYGKQVEHLKSVIKSCGMSVPPSVYKKVKQAPENKREASLIKELEELLRKEGLSTNPSEKEIKEIKKRKDRAKELEGIDMSNIVFSSRRRSTSSFPPPRPTPPVKNDDESSDDDDNDDDDNDDEDGDNNDGDDEVDNEDEEVGEEEDGDEGQDDEEDDGEDDQSEEVED